MTLSVSGDSITFPDLSTLQTAPSGFGFKNRIINGDMRIDQRNAGASVTPAGSGTYSVDRFSVNFTQASKYSVQQNAGSLSAANMPLGFTNYLGITSLAATSAGASDFFFINQSVEGFNTADLNWGSANAQTATLSFWVRSSLTGTFGGALRNSAANRSYIFSYTVSSANTWEQKTVTIAGDTTGTWLTNSSTGIQLSFSLGVGSTFSGAAGGLTGAWAGANYVSPTGATSVVGTSGATFYITGVQLEKGSTATAFDYRDYGRELSMCQRYYHRQINYRGQAAPFNSESTGGKGTSSTGPIVFRVSRPHPVQMRATPSVGYANIEVWDGVVQRAVTSINNNNSSIYVRSMDYNMSAAMGGAGFTASEFTQPSGFIDCSAEL
jgi:hypothetical protein